MVRHLDSERAARQEDQQCCFADLITDDALFALLDLKKELAT